jgi:rod shape-determining protein MreD
MSSLVKNIIRCILFILIQVFVLDRIHLHKLATPYLYFLFIIWLPFNMSRSWQLLIAFAYGFALDSFRLNPGFHAAACVLIAYIRPFFISILIPQEGADTNYNEPSIKSMGGFTAYFVFVAVLTVIHHAWLFFLEAWQVGNVWYFFGKTLLSSAISLGLIFVTELLFVRKQKFKTNTV